MTVALALYVLATLDAAFCGYRAAAGRNALIRKRRYYRRAMLRGALWGQAAVALAAGALLAFVLFASDPDPAPALETLTRAGSRMLVVYVPYAAVILAAFAARMVPSVDVRSLTSTLVFGPLTFLRPFVAAAGLAAAVAAAPSLALAAIGAGILALMLSMESFLGRCFRPAADAPSARRSAA